MGSTVAYTSFCRLFWALQLEIASCPNHNETASGFLPGLEMIEVVAVSLHASQDVLKSGDLTADEQTWTAIHSAHVFLKLNNMCC